MNLLKKTDERSQSFINFLKQKNPGFNSNFTKTDLEVLQELTKNPREKIEKIAKKTKLSTKTVTRCIEKLHENEGVQFTLIYDPEKFENYIPYAILAWIDGKLKRNIEKHE